MRHKNDGVPNPKDVVGSTKIDLSLLPSAGILHGAHSLVDGATKYGPYNFREFKIQIMTYISAIQRHMEAFKDGEDIAPDSEVHHLGHVIGCCSIILDAIENNMVIDNRPPVGAASRIIQRMNGTIARRDKERSKKLK